MWLARDQDGRLYLYKDKPYKEGQIQWYANELSSTCYIHLEDEWFPEVKWEDEEPTKVKFVLDRGIYQPSQDPSGTYN